MIMLFILFKNNIDKFNKGIINYIYYYLIFDEYNTFII